MEPEIDRFLIRPLLDQRVRLRSLVLVMREPQIDSTDVKVDMAMEEGERHRRTLDMPTRKTWTPW